MRRATVEDCIPVSYLQYKGFCETTRKPSVQEQKQQILNVFSYTFLSPNFHASHSLCAINKVPAFKFLRVCFSLKMKVESYRSILTEKYYYLCKVLHFEDKSSYTHLFILHAHIRLTTPMEQ